MAYNSFINKQVGTQSPKFEFKKDRANAAIVSGDGLGEFNFLGFDGTAYLTTSRIISTSSGTIAANRIGSNLEFYTHSDSVTASTQRMVISNVGEVTINTPDTTIPALQVTNNGTGPNINLRTAINGVNDSPHIHFTRSRAGTADVQAGDDLGRLEFRGFQGGTAIEAADIRAQAQTVNGASVSGSLQFRTRPTTFAAIATRMTVSADGNVTINAPVSGNALTVTAVAGSLAAAFAGSNAGGVSVTQPNGGSSSYQAVQSSVDVQPVYFNAFKNRAGGIIVANDVIYQLTGFGFADTNRVAALQRIFSTNIGANYVSGGFDWWTTSTAGATNQRMILGAEGNVTINAPVSGIALNIVAGGETITAGDLTITSGNVYLPNTTSTPIGVVFQGGNRFIHSFGASGCTYIGQNAGSIAVSNTSNNTTAVGNSCLTNITTGNDNVGVGSSALALVTTAGNNVAMGTRAASYTTGNNNTAIGFDALRGFAPGSASGIRNTVVGANAATQNNNGNENVYIGFFAGLSTTGGSENVVIGSQAFVSANASQNVVIGYQAGYASTGFTACTVVGKFALNKTNTGLYNLMLGYGSGTNFTGAESSNICLHSDGVLADSNTLRIGQSSGTGNRQLNRAFICGIDGVNVGSVAKVLTMASDQIGTATITAGAGISVTPGANTITIATTNGIAWTEVTGTSQAMAVDNGYIASNAGLVTLTLPATAVVGDRIRIAGKGAGGWRCGQNAGQTINFGNTATTAGVAGYIDSTNQYDALELLCITANTTWVALSSVGNLNVV